MKNIIFIEVNQDVELWMTMEIGCFKLDRGEPMKYFIAFAVSMAMMCIIADIAFRYEMKKYKEELERKK